MTAPLLPPYDDTQPARFDNSYARLPDAFYSRIDPTPVRAPQLIKVNTGLARAFNIDDGFLCSPAGVSVLSGNLIPATATPLAMAYAGHQFGNFVPQLGDGRAVLLGEVADDTGQLFDIHLKGAGRTPYSRNGDGRAWLGPVLREYVLSEAMAALGIPTTRALAALSTGEDVVREEVLPGALIVRMAQGHVRVGTFEYFAAKGDLTSLKTLADYAIDRFYPNCREADQPYLALFESVLDRQARLVAQWMGIGFIHGVMNTDNMSISGETIDYGPCAFMDAYHPKTVFSYIDQMGRYAFANQAPIAKWNLSRLAASLIPILHDDETKAQDMAQAALDTFEDVHEAYWTQVFNAKLGLAKIQPEDSRLARTLLHEMARSGADFTLLFRGLADGADAVRGMFKNVEAFDAWAKSWQDRLHQESRTPEEVRQTMMRANPAFIPRNHRIEEMIEKARDGDFTLFEDLVNCLSKPFDDQAAFKTLQNPPKPDEIVHLTFCGT
ncbi:YdiU family protein [Magnetovibrio sp. PR-2]|uniref:protein adenylyltransferase SelO n=1 Tax=Magnetovibrio sp. PR-2 TaxID=3120356 RepID=UPI002FCE4896